MFSVHLRRNAHEKLGAIAQKGLVKGRKIWYTRGVMLGTAPRLLFRAQGRAPAEPNSKIKLPGKPRFSSSAAGAVFMKG
ncbi:hypothetical protein D7X33_06125 [Butyricicoccus sp. 1XD8-22]|nr:hypothetical protein D7X33_06125 [Butyricicoccus sp. 1XD8-22]